MKEARLKLGPLFLIFLKKYGRNIFTYFYELSLTIVDIVYR